MDVLHCKMPLFLSTCDCSFSFPSPCRHLTVALDFLQHDLSMRWWGGGGAGKSLPPNTRARNRAHDENRMDNFKTWWNFRAQWRVWMTVGGEAAQPLFDWHPVAVSAHSVGGNKAQCHGNHIKSTLKLIYLQKQCVDSHLCFAPGVCFYNPMTVLFERKKNNQVRMITLWFIHIKTSLTFKAIHSVCLCLWCVFSVSMALSILYCAHL